MRRSVKAKLKPPPPPPQEQERTYTTREVMALCDVSVRQLQWWDDHGLVKPHITNHKRLYTPAQVTQVSVVAELRKNGMQLRKLRVVLKAAAPVLGESHGDELLVVVGPKVHLESTPQSVIERLKTALEGAIVLGLVEQQGLKLAGRTL